MVLVAGAAQVSPPTHTHTMLSSSLVICLPYVYGGPLCAGHSARRWGAVVSDGAYIQVGEIDAN